MSRTIELNQPATGPLAGVKVVDFTAIYSGPIATAILGDQGADVVKIEAADGDLMRRGRPSRNRVSGAFARMNRNKRSIVLDVRKDEGHAVAMKLLKDADVLVENFRPGVMQRLRLGYGEVSARNPRIIYLSINGVGATGPYAKRRMYDAVIQAISGMASIQADMETGKPQMINTLACDKITSLTAAQSVAAALYAREKTGKGQYIELSMLDASLHFLWPDGFSNFTFLGEGVESAPYLDHSQFVRATADGYVAVMPVKAAEWEGAFRALDLPNLYEDERFASLDARLANMALWQDIINAAYARFTTEEICARLESEDVPYSHINDRPVVPDDPQIDAMDALHHFEHPVGGPMRQPRPPAQFHGTPSNLRLASPEMGEHGADILAALGYDAAQITALREQGILG
ncbi:MAG: CoA transferase [Pseudomonadales bacterium]|nr:CoA transferase [Pseudomonadales bacterium]